jgi:hypothetical protein
LLAQRPAVAIPNHPAERITPRRVVKCGIVWRSFAGLSGVIEVERNAFANGPNAVTCIYLLALPELRHLIPRNYATYLRA